MRHESTAVADDRSDAFLRRILIALTTVTALIMGLWAWIQQNQSLLPPVHSDSGKTLLRQYQGLTHDIWLILLLLSVGYLINQTWVNQQREATQNDKASLGPVGSFLQFVRRNRITTILFISYTVAMIIGTTYLYKDMVGWYADLVDGYFLDNFSLKGSFIKETMRRTDYRFFPLAHQDIHILSWFSIHIKTWMLFSAAELVGIVLLCMKFLKNLEKQQRTSAAPVLFIASMLLIHPSTGTAFFHVIYCERMLCLVFMLYINAYLEHLQTGRLSSFYTTLLWALIGIYIKDIAILLFVIPPASLWAADVLYQSNTSTQPRPPASLFSRHYRLEHWLCSLSLVFISSYIILAFIPSSYVGEGAYNDDANYYVSLDFRFYLFALIAAARAITVAQKKIELGLLDAINLSAFTYAITLSVVYKFDSAGYLALPFQLIATINIAWAWIQLIEKRKWDGMDNKKKMLGAIIASTAVITTNHLTSKKTFASNLIDQKFEQAYIQSTYEKLDQTTREIREKGSGPNVIIHQKSRLSAYRHLDRIPYRALIEYIPRKDKFIVKDGKGKGTTYTPKPGDLVANLDKSMDLIEPILQNLNTETVYRHNPTNKTGLILKITGIKP